MTERQLQFRIGLFVIVAGVTLGLIMLRFGEFHWLWEKHYSVAVHFDEAPGVSVRTPVRKNGIAIGMVREVYFEEERGGVTVLLDINEDHPLRKDSQARLSRSLLGDAAIEFSAGISKEVHAPGAQLKGAAPVDPLEIVHRIESQTSAALESFAATSSEWREVARNVNLLVGTQRGNLDAVIERAAEALNEFTVTMRNANQVLGDPQNQANLQKTLEALPEMVADTRQTIAAVRSAVQRADQSLGNIQRVTEPLAERSEVIVASLERGAQSLESLLGELKQFSRAVSRENGSLKMLVSDPELYQNLNASAGSLQLLLKNMEPAMKDLRIFSDKVARHPELIGVRGALRGSSGVK